MSTVGHETRDVDVPEDIHQLASTKRPLSHQSDDRCRFQAFLRYNGGNFIGWQRQSEKHERKRSSVQSAVEAAIKDIFGYETAVCSVSRTDAGTHALMQCCTFSIAKQQLEQLPANDTTSWMALLNKRLSPSVQFQSLCLMPSTRAVSSSKRRRGAKAAYKQYKYYVQQGPAFVTEAHPYSWYIRKRLDIAKVKLALQYLLGQHDFKAFGSRVKATQKTTHNMMEASVTIARSVDFSFNDHFQSLPRKPFTQLCEDERTNEDRALVEEFDQPYFLCISFTATGFITHMVRRIISTVRWIGEGTHPPELMRDILEGKHESGPAAPARGLWLHRVWLEESDFCSSSSALVEEGDEVE